MKNKKQNSLLSGKLKGLFSLVLISSVFLSSCGGTDDSGSPSGGDRYKVTVTLTNVNASDDFVSVVVVGVSAGGGTTVWKVNGVTRTGESGIGLGDNDFTGATTTYVIESTQPVGTFTGGVDIINSGPGIGIKYKIERNNEVLINEDLTLTGENNDFTRDYSF